MKTLFLHGFNGGSGLVPEEWISPQLDYSDVQGTLKSIRKTIEEKNISYVVAKSIGAYFALALYNEDPDLTLFLINPSLRPYETLKKHDGTTLENYKHPSIISKIPVNFSEELKRIDPIPFDNFIYYTGMLFVEFGDEVVDQVKNYHMINCMKKNCYEDGDHAFTRMEETVKYINTFIKYDFV